MKQTHLAWRAEVSLDLHPVQTSVSGTPFFPVTLGVEVSVLCGAAPLPWVTLLLTAWMLFFPEVGFILAASWIFRCFMECWWILGVPQRGVVPVVVLSRLHQAGWAESSSFLWSGSFTDSYSRGCLLTWHLRDTSVSSMIDWQVWWTELCLKHLVFLLKWNFSFRSVGVRGWPYCSVHWVVWWKSLHSRRGPVSLSKNTASWSCWKSKSLQPHFFVIHRYIF